MSVYKASRNIPANHFLLWMGGVGEVQLRLRAGEGGHHPVFFLREGVGRFDFGFGGHCEQCVHRARRIIPAHLFFVWRRRVGEVRLRVRRRVRWSSRAMSVQSLVHHPSKPFSFCGLGGLGRFDFGFGFGFVGHCKEFPYKARCIIPATFFFLSRGGWGGSTSGSASGSMVISSNVCTKPGASCQQTFGAWGGSTSGSALGTRLLSNRNIISSAFGTQSSVRQ